MMNDSNSKQKLKYYEIEFNAMTYNIDFEFKFRQTSMYSYLDFWKQRWALFKKFTNRIYLQTNLDPQMGPAAINGLIKL